MPELPEVEIIKKSLEETTTNREILSVEIYNASMVQHPTKEKLEKNLIRRIIKEVNRRGKYLIIKLSDEKHLVVHLRMTGQLVVSEKKLDGKYLRARFKLSGGLYLDFYDKRKFGTLALLSTKELKEWKSLAELGPEPLQKEFTYRYFKNCLLNSKRPIKNLILDQKIIAGLGNIYADEALFKGKVNPFLRSKDLNASEMQALLFSIKMVLIEGIKYKGTSFSDYIDAKGQKGNYQDKLNVYQRSGENCINCSGTIKKVKLAGRSTFFCPNCQPPKK